MSSSRRYNAGTVHYLNFDDFGPMGSEMVKGRGVVIVSPPSRRDPDLVIVVPLSTLEPLTHKRHTVRIIHNELNGSDGGSWAKCDMPVTVSVSRLGDYRRPKYVGQNQVPGIRIKADELRRVRRAMFRAIGGRELLQWERKVAREALTSHLIKPVPKIKPVAKSKPMAAFAARLFRRRAAGVNRPVRPF